LGEVFNIYSTASLRFAEDILTDFKNNEDKIKIIVQNHVVTKHPRVKSIVAKCIEETSSLWLTKRAGDCDPKHLAIYAMFLLFFTLSDNDQKNAWRVRELDEDGNELPMYETIQKSIQNVIQAYCDVYLGGQTQIIDNLRKIANESTLQYEYSNFFMTGFGEAEMNVKMTGGGGKKPTYKATPTYKEKPKPTGKTRSKNPCAKRERQSKNKTLRNRNRNERQGIPK
jgi:hypothetical protein